MPRKPKRENTSAESRLYRKGSLSMALQVLQKRRKEMHAKEIAAYEKEEGSETENR